MRSPRISLLLTRRTIAPLLRRAAGGALACSLVACGDASGPGLGQAPGDPAAAQFVTSDIVNFWKAYDEGGKNGSTAAFQTHYLDKASPGLADFIQARQLTAQSLVQMVQAYASYFAAIRTNTLLLAGDPAILATVRANFVEIEALYPAAVYPPVTFLIGRFSTGGTFRQSGMLIGTEFYAIDATTPLHELGSFQRVNVKTIESLPLIVAHEHVHVLQAAAMKLMARSNKTLLEQSVMEGSADFVGELVAGGHVNTRAHEYGLANEAALWTEFQAAMNGTNVSQWLYNQGTATGTRPGDLGYFIGYRIAQAYYTKAADKAQALREIIEVDNVTAFLTASGYTGTP
jgi:hypothetical protein